MTDVTAAPPVGHTTDGLAGPVNSTAQAYETVRRAIIGAELRPGQVVSQVQLAAQLNISRTPLREALRRLQSEGLLEGDFNHRLRVAPLSVEDLEQLAAMRIMLETFAVRTSVPKISADDLQRASAAFDGMDLVWSTTGCPDEFRVHHRIFHTTLFSAVGERMRSQLEELWDQSEHYRASYQQLATNAMTLASIAHDEHAAILESAQHFYRRPELRAIVEEHRRHGGDALTLTGLQVQIDQLRLALEAVAANTRRHDEQLRKLHRPKRTK